MSKAALRKKIKKLLAGFSSEEFRSPGEKAAVLLRSSAFWFRYGTVFLFLSLSSEIDTRPLLEAALKEGKKVFVPKVEGDRLSFFQVFSPDGPWRSGPFGIREPGKSRVPGAGEPAEAAAGEKDFPALVLAPGLAFDREGNRLGRGGGYYDRFFAELDEAGREYTALGLCVDFQLVEKVPAAPHDKKMEGVLTDKELRAAR